MNTVDVNCLTGHWPFRKISSLTFEDLRNVHNKNGIVYGYVSSLNSIFYNDPFEGDEELHEMIRNTAYRHVLTVNPMLPAFEDDIARGLEKFQISGVRVYPGYHNYSLDCREMKTLCSVLRRLGLPLFLTLRAEDERLNYLITPRAVSIPEIQTFIEDQPDLTILLLNIRFHEIIAIKDAILHSGRVFVDTSGLKDQLFNIEKLTEIIGDERILYGSLHPLYCMESTLLQVTMANAKQKTKNKILFENSRQLHI